MEAEFSNGGPISLRNHGQADHVKPEYFVLAVESIAGQKLV